MVIRFTVYPQIALTPEYTSFPIHDELGPLAGAGVVDENGHLQCFLAPNSFPSALELTSGMPVFITPTIKEGVVVSATISAIKVNESSIKVEINV